MLFIKLVTITKLVFAIKISKIECKVLVINCYKYKCCQSTLKTLVLVI